MKKIISFSLSFIITFLITYITLGFINLNFDMTDWLPPIRFLNVLIPFIFLFFKWLSYPDNSGDK